MMTFRPREQGREVSRMLKEKKTPKKPETPKKPAGGGCG
jgi:hypothetical protein